MKKANNSRLEWWFEHGVGWYKYLLIVFAFLVFAYAGSVVTATMAATGAPAGQSEFRTFNDTVCNLVKSAGTVVGGLAVIMVMAAGIMYAMSGGSGKGAMSIDSAKTMITSAITGVILYVMGSLLLGTCGEYNGGLLRQWINRPPATSYEASEVVLG